MFFSGEKWRVEKLKRFFSEIWTLGKLFYIKKKYEQFFLAYEDFEKEYLQIEQYCFSEVKWGERELCVDVTNGSANQVAS